MLIYSLVATASLTFILFMSIQKGQWLDLIFDWQTKLREWDNKGNVLLFKIGGGCQICFSHFFALISFIIIAIYYNYKGLVFEDYAIIKWVFAYLSYVSISTTLNLYFITKLFK